jgi:two-component system sensor histidine kinase/response regulator
VNAPGLPGGGAPPKILLVDDLHQNIVALEAIVGRGHLQLLSASSGPEALEIVLREDIALALVDVQMPGMDGFELAELMRGNERTRNIPIIFLTAAVGDPSRQFRGYEAGAVDFLSKPFDPFVLRSKIEVFVQLYHQKRRLAEKLAELEEALRLNELFTAVLGHDLRTPLSSVQANAEIVRRLADDDRIVAAAGRIESSSARMARMISQILELARVRASGFRLAPTPGDLHDACVAIREELAASGAAERVEIACVGDTRAAFDPDRMAQLLANLIGNALQHGEDAPVRVDVDGSDPARVVITVRNHGRIPPHALSMRQPLQGMSLPERSGGAGLGLGLHIVRHIAVLHGGEIAAENTDDGEALFRVSLPRAA